LLQSPITIEITLDVHALPEGLPHSLDVKLTWVGSAMGGPSYDQVLEDVVVDDLNLGINRFEIQSLPPDASMIPAEDLVGNTVVTLSFEFGGYKLATLGYHVTTSYPADVFDIMDASPHLPHQLDKLRRQIHVADPVLTPHWIDQPLVEDSDNEIDDLLHQASDFMASCPYWDALDAIMDIRDIDEWNPSNWIEPTQWHPSIFNLE
jgi:hypothetical protein